MCACVSVCFVRCGRRFCAVCAAFRRHTMPRICRYFNLACVFTKSWVVDTYFADSDLAKILQLGIFNNDNSSSASPVKCEQDGIIDVSSASIHEDRQLRSSGEDKK